MPARSAAVSHGEHTGHHDVSGRWQPRSRRGAARAIARGSRIFSGARAEFASACHHSTRQPFVMFAVPGGQNVEAALRYQVE
jgi:hypothetical protein